MAGRDPRPVNWRAGLAMWPRGPSCLAGGGGRMAGRSMAPRLAGGGGRVAGSDARPSAPPMYEIAKAGTFPRDLDHAISRFGALSGVAPLTLTTDSYPRRVARAELNHEAKPGFGAEEGRGASTGCPATTAAGFRMNTSFAR